ncbi:carboxypeptidase regulatory-like domain-containing protein [Algibacter sp. TI.3.09]|uniref:carboxypeptidase regulatory-like domain-containing protein n=1 Tax=Algibacter sp. TI.3.09 TaxID=3121298 RepID=UPI00311E5567
MIRFFYTLCFFCVCFSGWSQLASLKGNTIENISKKPITDAFVIIENTPIIQKTNALGEFFIEEDLPLGKITVIIRKVGYITRRFEIEIFEGKVANVKDINLHIEKEEDKDPEDEKIILSGTSLTGVVTHKQTKKVIEGARINIVGSFMTTTTDEDGYFVFNGNVPEGPIIIKVAKDEYTPKMYDIFINSGKIAYVDGITLGNDLYDIQNQQINTFTEDQLYADNNTITNNAGFYQSSSDIFLKTAATQFSSAFYKVRGQDGANGEVMINGVVNNSPLNGDTEWNSIGGLEEAMQNNYLSFGLSSSKYSLGGTLGNLNIDTRASSQRKGGKVSYFSSNRRFSHGVNATYATGRNANGFSLAVSATKRTAFNEGYFDGTPYDSNSLLISAESRINSNNAINFTGIFNGTSRNGRSANTNEVFNLIDNKYNSNWGTVNDEIHNSSAQSISQPLLMLNHYLNLGPNTKVQTNVAYSFGTKARSRLDFNGASIDNTNNISDSFGEDPNPSRASALPSFFFADADNPDYEGATLAREAFQNNGQINWFDLFDTNINSNLSTSIYALYEDVEKHSNLSVNSIADFKINSLLNINASVGYENYNTNNFARIKNLLGGQGYLDVNTIEGSGDDIQSDLLNPNRIVSTDDDFRYNYDLNRVAFKGFLQADYKYDQFDAFIGANLKYSNNTRDGNYQNGKSPYMSLGKGEEYTFLDYNVKLGVGVEVNSENKFSIRALYGKNAPNLNNIFLNARESDNPRDFSTIDFNTLPSGTLTSEDISGLEEFIDIVQTTNLSAEIKYEYNSPLLQASATAYFNQNSDGISNRTFLGSSFNQNTSSTIQEVLTDVDKKYMGVELGLAYKLLKTLSLKSAVAIGDFRYAKNANLQYIISEGHVENLGEAALKNVHVSGTPSNVYSIGFEYKDEDNWWFEAMGNYFTGSYVDINPYFRSRDFFLDTDGAVFESFNTQDATALLKQEKLDNYLTINLFGGKYWEINNNHIGFKAGINNILGQKHELGGYETQGQIKYDALLEDSKREQPLYGNRYWKGYGATYFANIYYRF